MASEEAAKKNNLTPLARIVAFSVVGVDPTIMGIGPAPAIRNVLKATGKTIDDIDLIEVNLNKLHCRFFYILFFFRSMKLLQLKHLLVLKI